MSAAWLDDLYPAVLGRLPGDCTEAVLAAALREAIREFCIQTDVWQERLPAHDLRAGQESVPIKTGWRADVKTLMRVFWRTAEDVAAGRDGCLKNPMDYCYDKKRRAIDFDPAPKETVEKGLIIDASLVPQYNCYEIPEWLVNQWAEAFIHGAVARLCATRNRPYYDPDAAARSEMEWRTRVAMATDDLAKRGRNVIVRTIPGGMPFIGA